MSPLVASYAAQFNFNRPYGSMLPRPANVFTEGAFGPLLPVAPVGIDAPSDSGRPDPRRGQYPVGWNLPQQPGQEGIKLTSFATLRAVADMFSTARACVDKRIHEIVGLGWDIVPTDEAEQAMRGDDDLRGDWEQRRAKIVNFFEHPDSDRAKYPTFGSWLTGLLEDRFVIDAVALHLHPPRKKGGGLFGSNLASLDLLAGDTIRPLLNLSGATPTPTAVGYQQFLWGVPRVDLMSVITDADLDELDEPVDEFRADQLLYLRSHPRAWTPYGFSPVEKSLLPISIGLSRQQYQQTFFSDGSIPGQWITPGPDISTPQQIRQLQDALNAMAGDIGNKHRIIVLPPGSKAEAQKPPPLADQTDEWILSQVTMNFGLTPMDLGVTPRVSAVQSPSESRQLSEINTDKGAQTRIEPETTWLKETIFDYVIQQVFGQKDMEWSWGLTDRGESRDDQIAQHIQLIGNGLESIDEGRVDLGHTPWGLPETSVPLIITATGAVPLSTIATSDDPDTSNEDINDSPEQPDQAQKPTDAELTTPAHEAAEDLPNTPGAGNPEPAAQKALTAELEILGRYLRKGRPVARFRSTVLPAEALAAAEAELPKGVAAAVQAAATAVVRKSQQQRRARHLHQAMTRVASGLGRLAHDVRKGRISHVAFVDDGVDVMAGGYQHAMSAGSADAADDHPDTPTVDFQDQAQERAQGQAGFLGRLLTAVMAASAVADLVNRLRMYADTLTGAYNAGYGLTVKASHPQYEIEWELGETEHCALCLERDGKIFTFDSLPGWPGDGGFGGAGAVCLGGPKCGCSLIYREGGRTMALGTNTQREAAGPYYQSQLENITAARQQAEQAREDFLGGIPADAAARAHTRDSIRRGLADLANQRIRQSGGYPGVSVAPQDIPAQMVADLLPPSAKSASPAVGKDLASTVYEALSKVYPAGVLGWVKKASWHYEKSVRLADIDMGRRPGGRDQSKVEGIAAATADGKPMPPVVLVDTGDPDGLQVADGYHRTLGAKRAGKATIAAYVATGAGEHGPWEREMHDRKLNQTSTLEADSMTSDIVPGWEGAQGPFRDEYSKPHVYARDIHSGAGNCVCGSGLGDAVHIQAAPGVDVPDRMR